MKKLVVSSDTEELKNELYEIIENLIVNEKIDTFFLGEEIADEI